MPAGSSYAQIAEWISLPLDLLLGSMLIFILVRRKQAGAVLLDLGPVRGGGAFPYVLGGLYLLVGAAYLHEGRRPLYALLWLLMGASQLVFAARRQAVCQQGILASGRMGLRLLRWENIISYELKPNGTLNLESQGTGWISRRVRIPAVYLEPLDVLLAARYKKVESLSPLFDEI